MEDKGLMAQVLLVCHFMPFVGPARYAAEAIIAYMYGDEKKARDKGIISTINGLIDLLVVSLFLLSAAHIAIECDKSDNLRPLRPVLTTGAAVAVISILVSLKIIAEQMSRAIVDKVVTVNRTSSSVVNTMTITATGIEAVVETINGATNATTNTVKSGYTSARRTVKVVINTPKTTKQYLTRVASRTTNGVKLKLSNLSRFIITIVTKLMSLLMALLIIVFEFIVQLSVRIISKVLPNFRQYRAFRVSRNVFNGIVVRIYSLVCALRSKTKIN